MDEDLMLPVTYRGAELAFPVKIVASGFGYRFAMLIDGVEVIIEKDDSGEYRALLNNHNQTGQEEMPEYGLLEAIVEVIKMIHP